MKPLFFERQGTDDTCRLHVINNTLGRSILSQKKFYEYCDEFDMKNRCKGSREFFFIHSDDNIISFILNKFHVQSSYYPPGNSPNLREDSCNDVMAVMSFNEGHIWCAKKYDNMWFNLNSLSNKPKQVPFQSIFRRRRQDFGWIIVWNSTVPKKKDSKTVILNQPLKSTPKRVSKRDCTIEDPVLDESFEIFERNESDPSNRFEILSLIEDADI